MTNGLLIYGKILRISSYIRKLRLTYDFATDPIWIALWRKKNFYQYVLGNKLAGIAPSNERQKISEKNIFVLAHANIFRLKKECKVLDIL